MVCCPKRKRPGKSFAGFEKAIAKLPMPVLRALAAGDSGPRGSGLRRALECGGLHSLRLRWHAAELPAHRGTGTTAGHVRQRRLVADDLEYVDRASDVGLSLLLAFGQRGQGQRAKPPDPMLRWLPAAALIVADAGYVGYEVVATMIATACSFLIRMSSNATFYSESQRAVGASSARGSSTTGRKRNRTKESRRFAGDCCGFTALATRWTCGCSRTWRTPGNCRWKRRPLAIAGGGKTKSSKQTTQKKTTCIGGADGPIVVVSALLKLARWCQQCKHSNSGGILCDPPRKALSPPRSVRPNQRVLLKQLWAELPPSKRQEVLRTLSRLVAQGTEGLAGRKEVGDEQHL